MAIEAATYVGQLNSANPPGGDPVAQGDDHIRLMKQALLNTFPGLNSTIAVYGDGRWLPKTGGTLTGTLSAPMVAITPVANYANLQLGSRFWRYSTVSNAVELVNVANSAVTHTLSDNGDFSAAGVLTAPQVNITPVSNYAILKLGSRFWHYAVADSGVMLTNVANSLYTHTFANNGDFIAAGAITSTGVMHCLNTLSMEGVQSATDSLPIILAAPGYGTGGRISGTHLASTWAGLTFNVADNHLFTFRNTGIGYSEGGWSTASDARVKSEKLVMASALDKVKLLTGYTFLRDDMRDLEGNLSTTRRAGLLAQDVEAVLPEAVERTGPIDERFRTADDASDLRSLNYDGVVALLVNAVKELSEQVKALEARLP